MPKYTLHVPVYGSLDLVITAENEQEVLERYLEERDNLLKFNDGKLQDDLDISYVVQINDKTQGITLNFGTKPALFYNSIDSYGVLSTSMSTTLTELRIKI